MKKIWLLTIIFLLIVNLGLAQEIKKADLAGSWYPSSPEVLSSMLDEYLDTASLNAVPSNIIAIIVPHAGYIYSGPVAAYAFKAVRELDIDTVVIIGFSHRRYFDGISVYDRGLFETPFGLLKVKEDLAKKLLLSHEKIYFNPKVFSGENSIEMELPFIKYIFKEKVEIVPIAIGVQSYENAEILGNALYNALRDKNRFLLVASTDMSHYHPYSKANTIDNLAIETLKRLDPKELFDKVSLGKCEFCGIAPVVATMIAAKRLGADNIKILKYANSGDISGKKDSVVGYLSAVIYKGNVTKDPSPLEVDREGLDMLSDKQKRRLLQIARETIEAYVKERKILKFDEEDPLLNKELGAFVTLHKNGQLRGCIGNIVGRGPLYLTVRDMAIESATQDPRFSPVAPSELEDIDIEISVLSELKKIDDPNEIIMGKHGVLVRKGFNSGVFLPQVATETGWSREEFMNNLCAHKAGLPQDAWKKKEVDIYVFTAEVFGEKTSEISQ